MEDYLDLFAGDDNPDYAHEIYAENDEKRSKSVVDLIAGLRAFVRVVELGSFSAVARETNTSQSAITRLVGQLEEHFGVRLFHRTTRRLSLTEEGMALLDHARRLLADADAMQEQVGASSTQPTGLVRVGLPVSMALLLVPRLPVLFAQYPGLSVELLAQDQMQDLVEAQMDLAVRAGPNVDSSLMTRALGTFHWLFVASPDYIARAGTPATPEDLRHHTCIVRTPSLVHGQWRFTVGGEERAVEVHGAVSVNESAVARRAALAGLGIARLDELHVHDDLQSGALVQVLADYPTAPVPLYLVYPSRRNLARRTRVVMEFLVSQAALGPRRRA